MAENMEKLHRNTPLQCVIRGGKLVIEIGIETLAFAAEESPEFWRRWSVDPETGETRQGKLVTVRKPNEWAKEVRHALLAEEEDGSTPITKLLDEAMLAAVDDGAMSIDIPAIGLVDHDDE